jgi:hypothetical protein
MIKNKRKMIELGARLTRCEHFRWLPGMALVRRKHGPAGGAGLRPILQRVALTGGHPCDPFACIADVDRLPRPVPDDPHWVPDLDDPATLGALLALVREAWGCHVHLRRWASPAPDMSGKDRSTWEPVDGLGRKLVAGPRVLCATEAEALVAALEAAP